MGVFGNKISDKVTWIAGLSKDLLSHGECVVHHVCDELVYP